MKEDYLCPGYILLISILIIGVIASAVVSTLLLLGNASNRSALSVQQSSQSLAVAYGCSEYVLRQLRQSPSYAGDELVAIGTGTCEIYGVGGIGNDNRIICVEGRIGDGVRRLEIIVQQVLPQTLIYSWQEVSSFSLCS